MAPVTRVLLTAFAVITLIVGAGVYLSVRDKDAPAAAQSADVGKVVRENSHRLNNVPESDVTFVEFLDFECEGCHAAFPTVEQLPVRIRRPGRLRHRCFPLPWQSTQSGPRALSRRPLSRESSSRCTEDV